MDAAIAIVCVTTGAWVLTFLRVLEDMVRPGRETPRMWWVSGGTGRREDV